MKTSSASANANTQAQAQANTHAPVTRKPASANKPETNFDLKKKANEIYKQEFSLFGVLRYIQRTGKAQNAHMNTLLERKEIDKKNLTIDDILAKMTEAERYHMVKTETGRIIGEPKTRYTLWVVLTALSR